MKRRELVKDNPLVDVAAYLFLEDIADKQGAAGMNTYLMSLASALAQSMPEEEYETWDAFVEALKNGDSALSTFEDVEMPTKHCVVTTESPFLRGWQEYTKRIGNFASIHYEVAEYYNSIVKPGAIDSQDIIIQTYRAEMAKRITVEGKELRVAHIATVAPDGTKRVAPEEWLPILLEKAGITQTMLNMIMRNNASVWIVYTE